MKGKEQEIALCARAQRRKLFPATKTFRAHVGILLVFKDATAPKKTERNQFAEPFRNQLVRFSLFSHSRDSSSSCFYWLAGSVLVRTRRKEKREEIRGESPHSKKNVPSRQIRNPAPSYTAHIPPPFSPPVLRSPPFYAPSVHTHTNRWPLFTWRASRIDTCASATTELFPPAHTRI